MSIQLAETAAWLDILYGNCDESHGSIVIVAAQRNRLAGIHQVGNGDRLVEVAKDMQRYPGCYCKINLMDADAMRARSTKTGKPVIGNRAEVKTIVSIHLDVDAGKSEKYVSRKHAIWSLDAMPKPPTLIINSNGSNGGFHAYWVLKQPHVIENVADRKRCQAISTAWNERLRALCAGRLDSTSNLDRVLRCVGVPRKDGGEVSAEGYWPSRLYQLEDFGLTD